MLIDPGRSTQGERWGETTMHSLQPTEVPDVSHDGMAPDIDARPC
jgi:hypothetical protein